MQLVEFDDLETLTKHLADGGSVTGAVIQGLDLTSLTDQLAGQDLTGTVILGGEISQETYEQACSSNGLVFRPPSEVPFKPYRASLYTPEELFAGFDPDDDSSYASTPDETIYQYCQTHRDTVLDSLAMRLHDHAITDALDDFIVGREVVAIMGGHSLARTSPQYRAVVVIAQALTERGFLVATGGGPGAMEAGHLGAWLAHRGPADIDAALLLLAGTPGFKPRNDWLATALEVKRAFPRVDPSIDSLGIPTWLYGHEPPTVFATCIAKYFANSVREEGLLAIAKAGVVFTPGSAGTIQEIFQDATQNHYRSYGEPSPMVFFGVDYWTTDKPVHPLLTQLAQGHDYAELISITDDASEVVELLTLDQVT